MFEFKWGVTLKSRRVSWISGASLSPANFGTDISAKIILNLGAVVTILIGSALKRAREAQRQQTPPHDAAGCEA
jgi:hypothetical protein